MATRLVLDAAEASFFTDLQTILSRRGGFLPREVSRICAADAAYRGNRVVAVASFFDRGRLTETSYYAGTCSFPYIPGLFYLREGPFVVQAVRRLKSRPQLLCFDAHGAAHPRSSGLATVCGMVIGTPSIGCAKSLLMGAVVPGEGGLERIAQNGKIVGFVTRWNGVTRYWSPGYSVSIRRLKSLIERCADVCLRAMAESDRAARQQV
jgi:deoxyribonuclease V